MPIAAAPAGDTTPAAGVGEPVSKGVQNVLRRVALLITELAKCCRFVFGIETRVDQGCEHLIDRQANGGGHIVCCELADIRWHIGCCALSAPFAEPPSLSPIARRPATFAAGRAMIGAISGPTG